MLPATYAWLAAEPGPKMLVEALKLYGEREIPGIASNPEILGWAKDVGVDKIYKDDDTAWCGLFVAVVAKRGGKAVPQSPLWALNWKTFGVPAPRAMLGDVLVFKRPGGGHVGLYVGEDAGAFHVLGGNQGNAVSIVRVNRDRLAAARRPLYQAQPANVRAIRLAATGAVSTDES